MLICNHMSGFGGGRKGFNPNDFVPWGDGGPTTWNLSDKSANVTLSGGNLIAAITSSADGGVRATQAFWGAKMRWQATVNSSASNALFIGFATSAWNFAWGSTAADFFIKYGGGQIFSKAGSVTNGPGYTTGDVIDCLYDTVSGEVWFAKNGVVCSSTPVGPVVGMYPAVSSQSGYACQVTANFAGPFTYPTLTL